MVEFSYVLKIIYDLLFPFLEKITYSFIYDQDRHHICPIFFDVCFRNRYLEWLINFFYQFYLELNFINWILNLVFDYVNYHVFIFDPIRINFFYVKPTYATPLHSGPCTMIVVIIYWSLMIFNQMHWRDYWIGYF